MRTVKNERQRLHTGSVIRAHILTGLAVCISLSLFAAHPFIDNAGMTVEQRFIPPSGYARTYADETSYAVYLRRLPLLAAGVPVKYFDGTVKPNPNQKIYTAVVKLNIGFEDLQQAPEACMRLRGEYLFAQQQYGQIAFTINSHNHERISYVKWIEGLKLVIDGKQHWTKSPTEVDRYATFWRYLNFVFTYADKETLLNDVQRASLYDISPGDMFIQAAHSGHVVVVVDVAQNPKTGDRVFLLAQSCQPAQLLHILVNPSDPNLSPWYSISAIEDKLATPEFMFYKRDLHRFHENQETVSSKK
ncbi:MAG: DUF4846 domain-containing protein [Prevotellaceae bacterium]|jgi:hypothetical protein|nr:DUF4846 domain-containing protein [Prevotellaceae bacterium]